MPFRAKPGSPALQTSHSFASELVGAWLFTESSGITLRDYSPGGRHLTGTGFSDGSWLNDGVNQTFLRVAVARMRVSSNYSDYRFDNAQAWTITYHLRTRAQVAPGPFNRLLGRDSNVNDLAFQTNDNMAGAFFNGGAWIDSTASSVSGANEVWVFQKAADDTYKVYKNSVEVYSASQNIGNTGHWSLFATNDSAGIPAGECWAGDCGSVFWHRRALSAAEVLSHYSDPYLAFTPPPNGVEGGTNFAFSFFG